MRHATVTKFLISPLIRAHSSLVNKENNILVLLYKTQQCTRV